MVVVGRSRGSRSAPASVWPHRNEKVSSLLEMTHSATQKKKTKSSGICWKHEKTKRRRLNNFPPLGLTLAVNCWRNGDEGKENKRGIEKPECSRNCRTWPL
ncbi:unnamed protein product [Microthlaspi erraticum]|uniref:Uncharacterized protein n=1 Tax=Microthlaspi erraticum TaxID=1685480 RepID=A0A6D2I4R9_9BRAS|nr:unnamed protein product [Microthlaspi erraticum]